METRALNIAMVEDDSTFQEVLKGHIDRFSAEENLHCTMTCYSDGLDLAENYKPVYDLIFLDVEMPHLNGMETARHIRRTDQRVAIIFVTNMAKYALQGYEVNAVDYILKPVEYFTFAYKFKKALQFCERHREKDLILFNGDSMVRVACSDVFYLEKEKNYIVYHTRQGDFRERGTMAEKERELQGDGFALCSSGIMANLAHVGKIGLDTVTVSGTVLPVSRQKRRTFLDRLMAYLGGQ